MTSDKPRRVDPEADPGAQPPLSDEPPIEHAEDLPGEPRPAIGRDNEDAPARRRKP